MKKVEKKKLPAAINILRAHISRMLDVAIEEIDYRWHMNWDVAFRIESETWDRSVEKKPALGVHLHTVEKYGNGHYMVVFKMFSILGTANKAKKFDQKRERIN